MMPASSAATERSFSAYSHIHTKKRNKLDNKRAAKLLYVAHNENLLNKIQNGNRSVFMFIEDPIPEHSEENEVMEPGDEIETEIYDEEKISDDNSDE